jgi:paraquat-inducible protein B
MSKKANPTAIGAFVVGAIVMVVAGIIVIGGVNLFKPMRQFTIFFEGSVNGLQVGSPVKAQGVDVGQVTEIRAVADQDAWTIYTETTIEVDTAKFVGRGVQTEPRPTRELVDNGLRARLETQSLLTGQLYVSLDFLPETEARLFGEPAAYPEIPALPTRFQEAENTLRRIAERLQEVPLDEVVTHLNDVLAGVDRFVNGGRLETLASNLEETLAETRTALAEARALAESIDANVDPLARRLVSTLAEGEKALAGIRMVTEPNSPLVYQTQATLEEMQQAARALRLLAGFLERKPNAIVFGRESED